ncbi:hypothetical protein SUGI_0600920 [Cryptomeria japonica]|nr:hypothetical protein SUGI_0600920 [Cryptomeria japonica]
MFSAVLQENARLNTNISWDGCNFSKGLMEHSKSCSDNSNAQCSHGYIDQAAAIRMFLTIFLRLNCFMFGDFYKEDTLSSADLIGTSEAAAAGFDCTLLE